MFVLVYEVAYEGQQVLGVYSSLESAMVAVQRHAEKTHRIFLSDLVIYQYEVDADAGLESGQEVWHWSE